MAEHLVLGFDTSAAHGAAALLRGDRIVAERYEQMGRGQAERLMPMLEEVLAEGGVGWRDLSALGVGVGPGNFTGIRIAVSAARGLALGLDVPAVGVTGCDARAWLAPDALTAIPAPRERVYLCCAGDGATGPRLVPRAQAEAAARDRGLAFLAEDSPRRIAAAIAHIAAARWPTTTTPPSPVYIRPAAAEPPRELPPVLLD